MSWRGLAGIGLGVFLLFATAGCGNGGGEPSAQAATESPTVQPADTPAAFSTVRLDEKQAHNVKVESLTERPVAVRLTLTGKVSFNDDETTPVLSPVAGQVQGLKVKVGDRIKKGDVLFNVKSRDVAAAIDDFLANRTDLELAEKTYKMTKELFEKGAAPKTDLQQAENNLIKAKTHVARSEQQLRILDVNGDGRLSDGELNALIPIKAPRDGTVVARQVAEGQLVQGDGTELLTVSDLSSVWVLADAFERDLPLVKVNQKAEVSTLAYSRNCFPATVSYISDLVDPQSRTVKLRLVVANPDHRLKPEMFASVSLLLDEHRQAITVPARAVFTENGERYVFVRVNEREFAMRPVKVDTADAGRLRVLHGLGPGDMVVSEGTLLLRGALRNAMEDENDDG